MQETLGLCKASRCALVQPQLCWVAQACHPCELCCACPADWTATGAVCLRRTVPIPYMHRAAWQLLCAGLRCCPVSSTCSNPLVCRKAAAGAHLRDVEGRHAGPKRRSPGHARRSEAEALILIIDQKLNFSWWQSKDTLSVLASRAVASTRSTMPWFPQIMTATRLSPSDTAVLAVRASRLARSGRPWVMYTPGDTWPGLTASSGSAEAFPVRKTSSCSVQAPPQERCFSTHPVGRAHSLSE